MVFLIVALIYCKPLFEGKTLAPTDTAGWKAMAQNSFQYKALHGHFPLWSEGLFSGMPGYQIAVDGPAFSPQYLVNTILTLGLPAPASLFFLASICLYLLALARLEHHLMMAEDVQKAVTQAIPTFLCLVPYNPRF